MNNSILPPLLCNYVPSYEPKGSIPLSRTNDIRGQDEKINYSSNEVEKKLKNSRAVLAQKRQMEVEEKALKEKEEKALHKLKMWNIVKEKERKRKQKILEDRVDLQHQIIKKRDELHEILEKQLRDDKILGLQGGVLWSIFLTAIPHIVGW